jgi:hypothetical protein
MSLALARSCAAPSRAARDATLFQCVEETALRKIIETHPSNQRNDDARRYRVSGDDEIGVRA